MSEWTPADWAAIAFAVALVAWLFWLIVWPLLGLLARGLNWWYGWLRRRTGTAP